MGGMIIFDIAILILGAYLISATKKMREQGQFTSLVVADEEVLKCKDKKAFIAAIEKQMMTFAMISLVYGVFRCVNDFFFPMGRVLELTGIIIYVAVWLWFMLTVNKQKRIYFY